MDPHYSDETLLQLIALRDINALEALYARYAQTTYNLIRRIVRDSTVVEEVLQDTFWQVWQKASEFRGEGAAAAWLYRIARNKSLEHLRRQKARPTPVTITLADEERPWSTPLASEVNAEHVTEQAWRRQRLRQALNEIPAEQRHCLELAYFEGMSQREIADYIHTPLGTVKTRIRLGLEKLERLLRTAGVKAEDIEI